MPGDLARVVEGAAGCRPDDPRQRAKIYFIPRPPAFLTMAAPADDPGADFNNSDNSDTVFLALESETARSPHRERPAASRAVIRRMNRS